MDIQLSRESEVPLRRQLAEQIVFLIGVGKLRPGQQLPSVRELARRLKIHHNTVSQAYQALVRRTWLVRQRGSRLVVGSRELRRTSSTGDSAGDGVGDGLDEVINAAMRRAREEGYSLKQLRERVKPGGAAAGPHSADRSRTGLSRNHAAGDSGGAGLAGADLLAGGFG